LDNSESGDDFNADVDFIAGEGIDLDDEANDRDGGDLERDRDRLFDLEDCRGDKSLCEY
jgi:hypothetical protein